MTFFISNLHTMSNFVLRKTIISFVQKPASDPLCYVSLLIKPRSQIHRKGGIWCCWRPFICETHWYYYSGIKHMVLSLLCKCGLIICKCNEIQFSPGMGRVHIIFNLNALSNNAGLAIQRECTLCKQIPIRGWWLNKVCSSSLVTHHSLFSDPPPHHLPQSLSPLALHSPLRPVLRHLTAHCTLGLGS